MPSAMANLLMDLMSRNIREQCVTVLLFAHWRSPDEAVFDFRIDPVQPLLCALRSFPVHLDFTL